MGFFRIGLIIVFSSFFFSFFIFYKIELPGVLWVLPDSYLDVPNKDYGGELCQWVQTNSNFVIPWSLIYNTVIWYILPLLLFSCCLVSGDLFIDGQVIPRPQFRFSDRQQPSRNRPRPRFDRRRGAMQVERREPMHNRAQNLDAMDRDWGCGISQWKVWISQHF